MDEILIVGGGICGLGLALNLHQRGIPCRVFERTPVMKELGVGITLLPHAMRELAALGVDGEIVRTGVENRTSKFFNRFGQLIYEEPRGRYAGSAEPEIGFHRGRLLMILYAAARERLGDKIETDRNCVGAEQTPGAATAVFRTAAGSLESVRGRAVIACDGVNSSIRRQLYPSDAVVFAGINTWRGVTLHKPIFDGATYIRVGSINTGKMVIYPMTSELDANGRQPINWVAEIKNSGRPMNDWNTAGRLEDFYDIYRDWEFDWLDVADLISNADSILEYPMVDKEPLERWTFDRITLAGDAAHPMYPRGSNGAAQALVDARILAECLHSIPDTVDALRAYESRRLPVTGRIVRANRDTPPDAINMTVERLVGDRPFDDLNKYISQDDLRRISENYKTITAG